MSSSELKQSRRASYTAAELLRAQQKQYAPPPSRRNATVVSKTDLLLSMPPPVLHLAAKSHILVSISLFCARLFYWNHPNAYAPWLLLGSWLLVSLAGDIILRWAFPLMLVSMVVAIRLKQIEFRSKSIPTQSNNNNITTSTTSDKSPISPTSSSSTEAKPYTPAELSEYMSETSELASMITHFNQESRFLIDLFTWKDQATTFNFIKLLLTSYPFYLVLMYIVSLRTAICLVGCVVITWNARWARVLRHLIYKSSLIRVIGRICLRVASGFQGIHAESRKGTPVFAAAIRVLKQGTLVENRPLSSSPDLHETSDTGVERSVNDKKKDSNNNNTERNTIEKNATNATSIIPPPSAAKYKEQRGQDVYFLFTIFENQRWWVALDWTSALLPNERPSWSDAQNGPVSPPDSFELPQKFITYTRSPTRKDPDAHIKRTYEWRWYDPEWRVRPAYKKDREEPFSRPRSFTQSSSLLSFAGNKGTPPATPTKKRSHIRSLSLFSSPRFGENVGQQESELSADASAIAVDNEESSEIIDDKGDENENEEKDKKDDISKEEEIHHDGILEGRDEKALVQAIEDEWDADINGWQYGDNAWEKMSGKVGMGRYTRRRAWIRRAFVVESLEHVSGDEARRVENENGEQGLRRRNPIEASHDS